MKKRIISMILSIVMVIGMLPVTVFATDVVASGYCGGEGDGTNLTWSLDSAGVLTISGTGPMANYSTSSCNMPWYAYAASINKVFVNENVTSIGDGAFYSCYNMTDVSIANSVNAIGYAAFQNCYVLSKAVIPSGVETIADSLFYNCFALQEVILPETITKIGMWSFYECGNLRKIILPDNIENIGRYAFHSCENLMIDKLPNNLRFIGDSAFGHCDNVTSFVIPKSVVSISDGAFRCCEKLTSITVEDGNAEYCSIDGVLFNIDKSKLIQYPSGKSTTSYEIPNTVIDIGESAFEEAQKITNIVISDNVETIGLWAFSKCDSLQTLYIPDSVSYINGQAFLYCKGFIKITVSENNSNYSSDENGVLFNKQKTHLYLYPSSNQISSYKIPNTVSAIEGYAFYGCSNLKSIYIPTSVNYIYAEGFDSGRFIGATQLTDVYYAGSEDQWNSINIGSGNNSLLSATMHYNSYDDLLTPAPTPNIEYTRFGQYNGSTLNYVIDPVTGFGKNLMKTVTIDGITYDVAATCEQESLYLPTDYLGNYYYIAYNLNESNEVSEAKIMPGIVCTLEGFDPATKVVDTDYEPIIPVGEDRTLPSGSFYVSDVTESSFPSDQIGSWVGDQVRIYCVGEQIFKVIHVVEGSGVITDYDEDNSIVYIDDTGYNVYPDAELINTIKQSILYSKDYVLYDNILVSLSSDNKYLSVEINNTGKSYFVGDEIRFFIYDCTETEDDYLHWTKPEGLVVQISDNETISLKKHIEYDDFAECVFVADKPGVVTVNISDDITSTPIAVTLHIAEDKYQSLRANNVPTYEYDIVIDKDFYNAYVNGMYVTDFTYKYNSYGTYTFDFSVYNETYAPGVVEVYNEKGELIDIKTIKKFSDPSSLKSVVYGGKDMIVDLWNGDSFSFRGVSASKKTEISVEVPVDGYVVVTNSCVLSPACLYVNLIDYFLTGTSLIDSTVKFDTDTFDYISRETIWAVLSSEYGTSTLATFHEDFFKEYATTIAQGSVSTIFGIATDNINMLFDSIDVNFEDILKDAGIGYAFSTVQGLLQKGGGPAGAALSAIFYVQKMLNFVMQTMHLANNSTNEIAWAVFTPYIDDRGMTEITSKDGITVKSEDEFPTDTILQVYKIVDYSNETSGLDIDENDNYTLYDISLIRRGQEAQPDKPITVYIPIPEGYSQSSVMVYKQDQYGNWEFVEIMIYNGMIVFEVDHFCLFAIIEDSKDNYHTEYTVTFNPNGGTVSINALTTNSDSKLTSLPTATRNGYTFDGWYTDPVNGTRITTSTIFTSNTTVYAHWTKETTSGFDEDYWYWALMMLYNQQFDVSASATEGGTITPAGISKVKYDKNITYTITPDEGYAIADVLVNGESVGAVSEYTIKRIKKDQTIHAIFVKTAWENPYTDVSDETWYYEDVEFVSENGLMIGTGDNNFSPSAIVNRAMLVTVLWRLEGGPVVDSPVDFYDIPADEWYAAAVNWAAANGIVNGYGDGIFGAMNDLTHEQIMAILNRYSVYKKWSENVSGNADDSYTNSEWAENNVLWADINGMFDGIGSDISDLTEGADRAELAAYLRRFCERFMAE